MYHMNVEEEEGLFLEKEPVFTETGEREQRSE